MLRQFTTYVTTVGLSLVVALPPNGRPYFELIIIKLKKLKLKIIKFAKVRKSSSAKLRHSESSFAVHFNNVSKQIS